MSFDDVKLDEINIDNCTNTDCDGCGAPNVTVIDVVQNIHERYNGPGPWLCAVCCQRVHETATAALSTV